MLLFLNVSFVGLYFTPLVWTGYILFVDALNVFKNGNSLIIHRRREFILMLPWSIVCWVIFEMYNLHLQNWQYIGLPEHIVPRMIGYGWSFATIFPAIMETAELFESMFVQRQKPKILLTRWILIVWIFVGAASLIVPLLLPQDQAGTLFGLVWVGFIFLLDPINYFFNGRSLFHEIMQRKYSMIVALALSGIVCGLLWEFWNYWAVAKWIYKVPMSFAGPKIFEMPLLGFLGFIPFAFECFVMQELLTTVVPSLRDHRSQ
jgi:hypothetical protein